MTKLPLQRVAARLPPDLTRPLRGTPVESAFQYFRRRYQKKYVLEVETPSGAFELSVWDDWRYINDIESGGMYEPGTYSALSRIIQNLDEPHVVDVGARWGIMSKYLLQMGVKSERITAVEPDPHHRKLLYSNLKGTDVSIINQAVGLGDGDLLLSGLSPSPDVALIDVDGAEWSVLRTLGEDRPVLLIEVHPQLLGSGPGKDGVTDATILRYLYERNYEIEIYEHRADEAREVSYPIPSREEYLVVAVPEC